MAKEEQKKAGTLRQKVLPPLRQTEVLASLAYLILAMREELTPEAQAAERIGAHVENIAEYARSEGTLTSDDLIPF